MVGLLASFHFLQLVLDPHLLRLLEVPAVVEELAELGASLLALGDVVSEVSDGRPASFLHLMQLLE